jgi:hypothetical protein
MGMSFYHSYIASSKSAFAAAVQRIHVSRRTKKMASSAFLARGSSTLTYFSVVSGDGYTYTLLMCWDLSLGRPCYMGFIIFYISFFF